MVFESLVANLLNKYLSEFVDELTAKQLNLFAWNGNISLDNIAIKSNAFDSLSLPFRVTHGHIARIEASFPWKSIYSSPVVIKLSDVYVVAVPNSETKYDDIKEELIEWNDKRKQLEKIEEAKLRSKDSKSDDKKTDDSFAGKLAAQIVKNLQVFITNVHICYEDQISWPNNPFQVGLTLHKLVFETQNNDHKKSSNEDIIYKLVTLDGLSFYWNCKQTDLLSKLDEKTIDEILADRIATRNKTPNDLQYILWPINFSTNAVINRKPEVEDYRSPVLDIQMDLDVFELRMTRMQFESLLLLLDAIDRMNLGNPYRKWRPTVPIKGSAKKWWRFAYNAIMETDIKRRTKNWSWPSIREHRLKMNRYQELYKQKLLSKNIDSIKDEIERLEKDLNLFSIVLARTQAEVETQQIIKSKKDEPKKGWFSGWFSKEETVVEENIVDEFKKEMNTKEKQKLYEAIGYEEGIPEEFPKDFIAHKIKFIINKLFVTISDENNEKITQLSLLGVSLDLTNRPSSRCLCVSNSVKSLYISGVGGIPLLEEQSTVDVLSLEFDMNPLDGQYDYGLNLRMSGFKLMYDSNTINTLVEMLSPPKDISLEELQSIAAYKLQDFTQKTATSLEYQIGKHKQIKLNVDIEPSYVIIPQLGQLESAHNILLLSLGHVKLSSQLIPKSEIPKVRDLISSHSDYEVILKMRKMAYESYKCHISEVQMILSDPEHWQSDMKSLSTTRHLLYPVEFNLTIDRSIVPNDPHLAKLKVEGQLPNIELKISDKQLTNLMNLLMTLPFGSKTQEEDQMSEEIDGMKPFKTIPRNNAIIESSKIMSAAIDLVKETVTQFEENLLKEAKEIKEESDGKQTIIAYKSVIFDFKLKEILVTLFQGSDRSLQTAVAIAKLNKFEITGQVLTDSTLSVNCYIGDLSLNDVRTSRSNTGIKTLFERNQLIPSSSITEEKDSIFSISFTQKSNERLVEITISGFRLILALDYLLNLSNIITKAFDTDSTQENIPKKIDKTVDKPMLEDITKAAEKAKQLSSSVEKTEITNILHFNLNKMEIVLLESIEVVNAPAIIMGCHSSIKLLQNPNHIKLYGDVSEISAHLTNYERYIGSQEKESYIMRPTNLVFNGSLNGDEHMLDISLSEVQVFISPPMVNVVLTILSKMGSSAENNDSTEGEVSDPSKLFKIRPNDTKSWYLSYVPEAVEVTEDFVDSPEKQVISTKQQVYLNIKTINVIIESGGLDSQPLIKMNSYFHGKLVGYKSLSANCSLIADYYNENNFFWEPLIEPIEGKSDPWDFTINVELEDNGKIDVKLESNEQLEATITKTSIDVLSSLNEAFANALSKQIPSREDNVVIVRNYLGIDLRLFLSNSSLKSRPLSDTKVKAIENQTLLIKTREEMSLIANDIKEVELNIGLILSDDNEIIRRITCHGHVIRCYNLPKKTYPTNEFWKWVVEVEDIDAFTKTITFKSNAQIVNQFNTSLDIFCLKRDKSLHLGRIKPLSILELPLDSVYGENCELKVKPSDDHSFSDKTIDWRNEIERRNSGKLCLPLCETTEPLILVSESQSCPENKFYIKVRSDKKPVLFEDTNSTKPEAILYQIRLMPIVKLKNLLPFRITYAIEGVDQILGLDSGEESDLPSIKLGETGIAINLIDYLERTWHCFRKIPSHGDDNDVHLWKFTAPSHDRPLSLDLAVKLSIESHSLVVSLFAPFWMINRTSQQLIYRIDDETVLYHAPTVMTPLLLSFKPKSFFCKKKLCLSIGDSKFSDGFSIDVVGSKGNVIAKSKNGKYNYYISVDIQLSRIGLSKIVTISPFYSIVNISKLSIEISEDNDEWFRAESMANTPFWPKQSKDQNIYLRLNSDSLSSKPWSLSHSSSTLVQVNGLYLYVDTDISEWDATIKISDYFEGSAPVLLVNAIDHPISFGQKGVTIWSSKTGEQRHVNTLPPNHSLLYTWYLPSGQHKLVWKDPNPNCEEQTVDLKCDVLLDVKTSNTIVVSFLDGKQRVLLFTKDYSLATNALQAGEITKPKINLEFVMKGIGLSIVNNETKQDLLYIAITSSVLWEIQETGGKKYKQLPLKSIDAIECLNQKVLVNKRVGENLTLVSDDSFQLDFTDCQCPRMISPKSGKLRRLANRGIWISLAMSEHIIQCHLKINRLQIDNQMPDHIFGIVMCPISPPKTVAIEFSPKSFIEFSTIIQKQPTITRFKYNSVLIQEFLIQIDRGLLSSIQELLAVAVKKESNKKLIAEDISDILQKNKISESVLSSRKSYYDSIHFSPLKVHVSFSLGGSSGGLDLPLGLDFIVRSAGVTLTEFNDVVFRLDYFERKNLLVENSELMSICVKHYTTQVLKQFYKLVLGLDLIGNPMKLVLGLKEGVGDFFYEPFQGIIQGPGEFAEGVQIGVKSLASNVVGGAAGALGSITNTLGEGVSALTMDDKFRRERRSRLNRKVGFAESGKNLFKGVFAGVTGVITQPLEGVREDGVEGFFKGVGKGVVGIVAQPTTGVIDFTSGTLQALKRTVDPKQEAKQMRPSRYVGRDGKVRPYNRHYATGHTILREMENGKYSSDVYSIHLNLSSSSLIMLTDKRLMSIKRGRISNNWECDWAEEWTNIDKIMSSADRLKIKITTKEQKKMLGIFSGDSDRLIATNSFDATQWLIDNINKQLKR